MKKILLSVLATCVLQCVHAQYKLSGTTYSENFNGLASGLPSGWDISANATDTTLGTSAAGSFISVPGTTTRWGNVSGAFKNVASANTFASFAAGTNAAQLAATDRALGVKQTGTFGDPGAAFTFCIDNTYGLSDFELDLKIQSLDSSAGGRMTPWQVQYGFGDNPKIFRTVSAFPTGGNTYKNFPLTISFGSSLDDKREKVWIRIFAVRASSGASSRTTTAIDDVELRWTGTAVPSYRPLVQKLFPANGATDVPLGSVLSVDFSKNISLGTTGNIFVKNETDNTTQTISAGSAFLNVSAKQLFISGVRLDPAKTYHITFDSTIVDTALAPTFAMSDTTEWRFSTLSSLPHFTVEYFDTACAASAALPKGWTKYSATGAEQWNCIEHTPGNSSIRMYGNDGTANTTNEDWLITPRIDMTAPDAMGLAFELYKMNSGNELEVLLSNNYAGSGDPDSATWDPVIVSMSGTGTDKWIHYIVPIGAHKTSPLYMGLKYTSTTAAAYDMRVDSFMTMIKTGIGNEYAINGTLKVVGYPSCNKLELIISGIPAGKYQLELFNSIGQKVYSKDLMFHSGSQNVRIDDLNMASGLYVLKLSDPTIQLLQKCILR